MAGDISKSVNVAINVINGVSKNVGSIVNSFNKITNGANKTNKSISDLNKQLSKLKAPAGIKNLGKDLGSLSKVNSKGVEKLADNINKLGKAKLPSFKKINGELKTHTKRVNDLVKAYGKLSTASSKVNLKAFSTNTKNASKQVNSLKTSSQKTAASFSQWGYALGSASTGLSKFGTQIYGVTRGFSAVSKDMAGTMAVFTSAFAAMFAIKGVVKDFIEFDDAIRGAGAVAQASSVQLTMLADAARLMGESTRYTAKDAAEALKALAMTGLDVGESIATLPTVLNLAAAANMGLGKSADIVTNIMVGYKKTVGDLPEIADMMTAAFTNSNTSLEEVGVALKYVGPVAHAAGQSLQETTGIIASLANAGYRGSKAGTTLRTAFSRLLSPTNKMSSALKHYGIELSDLTKPNGDLHSFTSILDMMGKKSITAGDALTIFGKRAGPGILSLLAQGTPAIEEMNRKIAESEGTALKAAYEMEAGLGGALRKLKSMWSEVSIAIGDVIAQDVQGFLERITSSLKKNKDQIVEVVSALFKLVGVFAKIVGWMTSFIGENIKLIAGLGLLTAAIKLLTMTSKQFMAVGIVSGLAKLATGIKYSIAVTGIQGLTGALIKYTAAVKAGNVASASSGIATFIGSWAGATGLIGTIKGIGTSLLFLGRSMATAAATFITANPLLAAAAVVIYSVIYALNALDVNYSGLAETARNAASAFAEVNREVKYQLAELKLINNEFEREGATKFADAEQRLADVIRNANLPVEEKIELLKLMRKGSDGAKEAIIRLNKALEEEKNANDTGIIKKTVEAREAAAKATRKQAVQTAMLYDVMLDDRPLTYMEEMKNVVMKNLTLHGLWYRMTGDGLAGMVEGYEELKGKQALLNNETQIMITQMVASGKSVEEFTAALDETDPQKVADVVEKFKDLKQQLKDNKISLEELDAVSAAAVEAQERLAKGILIVYKDTAKRRVATEQETMYQISVLAAQGQITAEQAEMAKLRATLDSAKGRIESAKETASKIHKYAAEGQAKAQAEIVAAEKAAATAKLAIIKKFGTDRENLEKKITKSIKDEVDEVVGHIGREIIIRKTQAGESVDLKEISAGKIRAIDKKLHDQLVAYEKKLASERKRLADERVDIEQTAVNAIANINSSAEDQIREIRQRSMTDTQKEWDNKRAAANKYEQGVLAIQKGLEDGDEEMVARGKSLLAQSGQISGSLKNQSDAIKGVEKVTKELIKTEGDIRSKGIKKNETELSKLLKAKEAYYGKLKTSEEADHTLKMKNFKEYQTLQDSKLGLIDKEIAKVVELGQKMEEISKDEDIKKIFDDAKVATDKAIQSTIDYATELEKIKDKEVNIKFTGEASPKQGLGKTFDDIQTRFSEISSEIEVNVKFVVGSKTLTDGLEDAKKEIESIDILIPISVNMEELVAATKVINEYRKKEIKVTVKVDSGELNTTANTLKKMIDKTVKVTMKVIGYDKLVKAKNMIDSIRSKTVTVTTRHKTVKDNAEGGYIEPEAYAKGGDVFRRLGSRFIGSGSGKKDDVPAMLMKGEFVQKVSAVKKYGKNFMSRLNAGLIPRTVAKMFSNGGDVQPEHYASGGHVGYSSTMSRLRKKHEDELFANRKESVTNFNVDNRMSNIGNLSSFGNNAIDSLKSVLGNAMSKFAVGGLTSGGQDIMDLSRTLNSDYDQKISAAKSFGDTALASILQKEQSDIASLSKKLAEDLKKLEDEYKKFKDETTKSHVKRIDEIKKNYSDDITGLDTNHTRDMDDLKKSYLDSVIDLDNTESSTDADYKKVTDQFKEDKKALAEESKLAKLDNAILHQESIMAGHDLGKRIHMVLGTKNVNDRRELRTRQDNAKSKMHGPGMGSPTGRAHAGSFTLDEVLAQYKEMDGSQYMGFGNPNFDEMKRMLSQAFPELASYLNGTPTGAMMFREPTRIKMSSSQVSAAKPIDYDAIGEDEEYRDGAGAAENAAVADRNEEKRVARAANSGNMGTVSVSFMTAKDGKVLADDIFSLEKSFKETSATNINKKYDDMLSAIKVNESDASNQYKDDSNAISTQRSDEKTAYELESGRKTDDYNLEKKNYTDTYNSDILDQNTSFANDIKDATETYKSDEAQLKSDYALSKQSINEATKNDANFQKQSTSDSISELRATLEEELKKIGLTSNKSSDLTSFFKDFKIRGFNTGGHVNPTATSVPGKDSILSALTPNEYVMKASVVKRFGKGFFDSLNNFRIPQFNTGGLVGGDNSVLESVANTVKHTLDLSINGNRQGELTGSPVTIENILNDLTLAKMRA